jgi:hypothetical protein
MEPITLTALAVFLSPYLVKAGEKIAEKTVEVLFESRKGLAEKFTGLFHQEITTLGLNDAATMEEVTEKLEARPEVKEEVRKKLESNPDLLNELAEAAKSAGITINAQNIGQVINNPTGPITQNNTFN